MSVQLRKELESGVDRLNRDPAIRSRGPFEIKVRADRNRLRAYVVDRLGHRMPQVNSISCSRRAL